MTVLGLDFEKSNERGELVFVDLPATGGGPHTHPITDVVGLAAAIAELAPLASPVFTGNPTAPTPTPGDADTSIATTGFVMAALAALLDSAPATLDTLNELAEALGNDPNFATTVMTAIGLKANASHSHAIADTTGLQAALDAKAPRDSPVFTGNPTAPTPATGDNDTSVATTAFVKAQGYQTAADVATAITGKLDASAAPELIRDTMGTALEAGSNVTITPNDAGDKIVVSATGGGGGSAAIGMIPRSGGYLQPTAAAAWTTSASAYAGAFIFGVPIVVPMPMTIDRLLCRIATNETGIPVKVLLYSSDADGFPSTLVASAEAPAAAAGAHVVTLAAPVALPAGLYWGFIRTDAGTTIRFWALASQSIGGLGSMAGEGGEQRNPMPSVALGAYATPADPITALIMTVASSNDVPYVSLGRA
jgi:hypothetical protein